MKRIMAVILAMCLMLCACSAVSGNKDATITMETVQADDGRLYEQALEHAAVLEEMLGSDGYLDLMTTAEGVRSVLEPYGGKSFGTPASAYKISFSDSAYAALLKLGDLGETGFSDPLTLFLKNRMQNSVMSMMNSFAGAETLAASSILTYSSTYAGESLEQNSIVLLYYPDACPVMVSFVDGGRAVQASSALLLSGALDGDSLEAVQSLFGGIELEGAVTVTELEAGE